MSDGPASLSSRPASASRRLERVERQFRQAERMAGIGTWRLTLADNQCEWSEQVFVIHGMVPGPQPDLTAALTFFSPANAAMITETVEATIKTGQPFSFETDLTNARGEFRRVRSMGEIELLDGVPVALIGVFQDITDQYALLQRLSHAAATDDLTGLANRGAFKVHLEARVAASQASGDPLALLLIDLDGFKAVNDAFGHPTGDEVLRDVAAELQREVADCFPARIGGDEFAVVIGGYAGCARLEAIVATLLTALRHPVRRAGRSVQVSGSIGVAWLSETGGTKELIAQADEALYEAKRGRLGAAKIFGAAGFVAPSAKRHPLIAVV